jgi:hypothetical protein
MKHRASKREGGWICSEAPSCPAAGGCAHSYEHKAISVIEVGTYGGCYHNSQYCQIAGKFCKCRRILPGELYPKPERIKPKTETITEVLPGVLD